MQILWSIKWIFNLILNNEVDSWKQNMRPLHNILLCTQETDPRQDLNEKNKTRLKYIDKSIIWNCLPFHLFSRSFVHIRSKKWKKKMFIFILDTKTILWIINSLHSPHPLKQTKQSPWKQWHFHRKKTIPYELLRFYCCLFLPEKL